MSDVKLIDRLHIRRCRCHAFLRNIGGHCGFDTLGHGCPLNHRLTQHLDYVDPECTAIRVPVTTERNVLKDARAVLRSFIGALGSPQQYANPITRQAIKDAYKVILAIDRVLGDD